MITMLWNGQTDEHHGVLLRKRKAEHLVTSLKIEGFADPHKCTVISKVPIDTLPAKVRKVFTHD